MAKEKLKAYTSGVITGISAGNLGTYLTDLDRAYVVMPDDVSDPAMALGTYLAIRKVGERLSKSKYSVIRKIGGFFRKYAHYLTVGLRVAYELLEFLGFKTPISGPHWFGSIKDVLSSAVTVFTYHKLCRDS